MVKTNVLPVRENTESIHRTADGLAAPIMSAAAAFLITNVRIGGALSPFGTSLTAALSPVNGLAALIGAGLSAAAKGSFWSSAAEISSMAVMTLYGYIFRRKGRKKYRAPVSGILYFLSSCAMTAGNGADWIMFAAVMLRSVMCAVMTLFFVETIDVIKNGLYPANGRRSVSAEGDSFRLTALAAVFIAVIASLCSKGIGILNPGRIAAGFCCAAAARKFGVRGGAAAGILSAAAFLLCDQYLGRSGSMLAFAAMTAGACMPKGKYSVNVAFICACFGITAAAGMPSGTPEFIADMGAAAVIYCLVPEGIYMPKLNGICAERKKPSDLGSDRLSFAAAMLSEIGSDVENASEMLIRTAESKRADICDTVRKRVCDGMCSKSSCSAAGSGKADILEGCFKAAQSITEKKGSITVRELPAGFEGCKKKSQLADGYNYAVRLRQIQTRSDAYARRFLENASEQLSASCSMMTSLSEKLSSGTAVDHALSGSAERILVREGLDVRSVCVSFDEEMHPFCEAYLYTDKNFSEILLSNATEKLGALLGAELEKPVAVSGGSEDGSRLLCRVRWWGNAVYYPDCRVECRAAEGSVCGDSHVSFEDGLGNFCMILSDGMGKGGRAAAESSMAVSLIKRLILSGIGIESAVKTLNVLMNATSSDEVFTTLDILIISCYTGKAVLIKMGAAPTLVYGKGGDGGYTDEYSECSAPIGILGRTDVKEAVFELDENSRVIMATDGVGSECCTYMKTLLENERLTCEQIADKLMAYSDELETESEEKYRRQDDKTAAAIRLYKCAVR